MKTFMNENFLLHSESAVLLYHQYASSMPIFDYHCHLSPKEIAENKRFKNITELWLGGDHYKWRAMRSRGVEERYITGDATDKEKFFAWAATVPYAIGNPLYHWTHLELRTYFNFHEPLSEKNAEKAWEHCNAIIQQDNFSVHELLNSSSVLCVCTTDDPTDTLEYHKAIAGLSGLLTKVLPTFRPDKGLEINKPAFVPFLQALEQSAGMEIHTYSEFLQALEARAAYFHEVGCRLSDHGLGALPYAPASEEEVSAIFLKGAAGNPVTEQEEAKFKTSTLIFLGKLYGQLNWTMQLHLGPIRNNNTQMFNQLGPDTGFDSIGKMTSPLALNRYLDALQQEDMLPKTILYGLNSNDNDVLASTAGNFQAPGVRGKIQFGSGWWFNDTKDGMLKQMSSLANIGLLSNFVGMLTDSRSFLSYTRHEYFRRILCNMIGDWVEQGEVPADYEHLGSIIQDICYNNARDYFGIPLPGYTIFTKVANV
ncbi:glucuronate isomerase [Paenibacillus sp. 1001270B_150601_E10]|uniref:glucuronate isomerase n=1 Tax=Paenibacillus sp. 1001270B_150601_E10 TaxID=2787079 RepID=UPI00189EE915|nr:glucuronate isomerase [Paenibacillus sp. 1001270B_150601_E10]